MKPIQLILIAVALVAALGAGFLMLNLSNQPEPVVAAAPTTPMAQVLVASDNIPLGNGLTAERLAWQEWPQTGVREGFITQDVAPEAIEEYAPTIARSSFFAGEPIREEKIVRSDSGYLSAVLPAGKRAIAVKVAASSSAGGFILPNDRVDVVLAHPRIQENGPPVVVTETILENVPVLAIDQVIDDEDGETTHVGDTATLQLAPDQVEIISAANAIVGDQFYKYLHLALRSVEDSGPDQVASTRKPPTRVRLIRFGKAEEVEPRK
ncbi:MAG: Flp pilus assembly protein CpaB [Rhizobiaceae bacterium]